MNGETGFITDSVVTSQIGTRVELIVLCLVLFLLQVMI